MYKSRIFAAFGAVPCGLLTASLMLCGCDKSEPITTYTVPKHESLQSPTFLSDYDRRHPKPNRLIGVVIPREGVLWFFKLPGDFAQEGNVDAIAARENDVREFLKTLKFTHLGKLEWALPAGWKQLPAKEMRYATLVLDGEPSLEMSVTQFPTRPDIPISEQVVMNINRWRGQLGLPPINEEDLATQSEKLTLNDAVGYWINIVGRPKPKPPAMQPPATQQPPVQREVAQGQQKVEATEPVFAKPEGWTEGPPGRFAAASLQVVDGDSKVAVTVTPARGDRLANVNRWRGQVKLEPITSEELAASAKKVAVGKLLAEQYEMTNADRTIFGVIIEDRGQMWFVKLDGDAGLAERERSHFEAFLKSLRFE